MTEGKVKKNLFKPTGIMSVIVEIVLLLAEAGFTALLLQVDVLPMKFLIPVIAALVLVFVAMVMLLAGRKRSIRRMLGFVFSVIILCVMVMGCYYLQSTAAALDKITEVTVQHDEYDVIVLKDSSYEKVKDIDGQVVYTAKSNQKTYQEAQGQLKGKVTVDYHEKNDVREVGNKLVDSTGATHDKIALLSKANYQLLCEDIDGFKKNTRVLSKMKIEKPQSNKSGDIDVTQEPFNVYISGIDVWGDINKRVSRSDVNMIMTVNPKTRQILLTSIPRDAYVKLHSFGQYDKLTHSGIYGIDETTNTVDDWLGIKTNYYVRADFGMIVRLVAAVGGIDVYSNYDFHSAISEFEYHKGWNHLNGKAALYFARERKSFKDMDQERIKNQQRVVKAILKKMMKSKVLLTNYTDILDAIDYNMQTDMSSKDMSALVKMQLNDMDTKWTINMNSIKGTMASKGTYSMGYGRMLDVCIMDQDSIDSAVKKINKVMYPSNGKKANIKDDKSTNGLSGVSFYDRDN